MKFISLKTASLPVAALVALGLGVAPIVLVPTPAEAVDRTVQVNTGAGAVNVRESASTSARILRTIPNKTRVNITCHAYGSNVKGPYGYSTLWNRLSSGGGWVADAMLETGSSGPVVPPCASPAPSTGRAWGRTEPRNTGAVGNCTWFVKDRFKAYTGVYPAIYGNGKDYVSSGRNAGWTTVADAQSNSIVSFAPGVHGAHRTYGHTAWVESTTRRSDGLYVNIVEMNAIGFNKVSRRTVKDVVGMSYLLAPRR